MWWPVYVSIDGPFIRVREKNKESRRWMKSNKKYLLSIRFEQQTLLFYPIWGCTHLSEEPWFQWFYTWKKMWWPVYVLIDGPFIRVREKNKGSRRWTKWQIIWAFSLCFCSLFRSTMVSMATFSGAWFIDDGEDESKTKDERVEWKQPRRSPAWAVNTIRLFVALTRSLTHSVCESFPSDELREMNTKGSHPKLGSKPRFAPMA